MQSQAISKPAWWGWVGLLLLGLALFHFSGNATRGYIDTRSLFVWWGLQWSLPAAELQHGPLIVLGAGWLGWRRMQGARSGRMPEGSWSGFAALVASMGLHLLGYLGQQPRLSVIAFLLFVWGWIGLGRGARAMGKLALPLALLLLSVPWGFLDTLGVGFHLRLSVAAVVEHLLGWMGIPIVRQGTQLLTPDAKEAFEVAAACAGLRSLTALVGTAVLLGQLQFSRRWKQGALVLAAAILVWLGNIIRVTLLVLLGLRWGVGPAQAWHDRWGFFVFLAELAALGALAWKMSRAEPRPELGSRTFAPGPPAARDTLGVIVLSLLLVVLAWIGIRGVGASDLPRRAGVVLAEDGRAPQDLPWVLDGGWGSRAVPLTAMEASVFPGDTGFVRRAYFKWVDPTTQVLVTLVLAGEDRTSIHRPELCLQGLGWTVTGRDVIPIEPGLLATRLRLQRGVQGNVERATMLYWFVGPEEVAATYPAMLGRALLETLLGRRPRWAYFAVQAMTTDESAGTTEEAMSALAAQANRALQKSGRR